MRIVTWNCCGHPSVSDLKYAANEFARYVELLAPLEPDICVLQEAPDPGEGTTEQRWVFWNGLYVCRGLAIVLDRQVFPMAQLLGSSRSSLLVHVGGSHDFNVLAIHSVPEKPSRDYVLEVRAALKHHESAMSARPNIVVGDFNSGAVFDRQAGVSAHADLVDSLESDFGLISAYHHHHGAAAGEEAHPTYYHESGNPDRPFHIDYCFVPRSWQVKDVQVGTHDQWCRPKHSDHCPMIVDLQASVPDHVLVSP